jgi:hypothetical protein
MERGIGLIVRVDDLRVVAHARWYIFTTNPLGFSRFKMQSVR